jgi:hypothetical protein
VNSTIKVAVPLELASMEFRKEFRSMYGAAALLVRGLLTPVVTVIVQFGPTGPL